MNEVTKRNEMPLLSIIVPVYNAEKYLSQCIDSILAQTVQDFELILVDDGSPDNSGKICDDYAGLHPNIKVVHQPNAGLTAARKSGILASKGKYIAFVDSDDWVDPDMYEALVAQAEQHQADMVSGGFAAEYEDHTERCFDAVAAGVYTGAALARMRETAVFDIEKMCQGLAPSTCTKVYLRESAAESFLSRRDSVAFGEDTLFTFPVLFQARCVVVDHTHCAYHYRRWEGSMTRSYSPKYFPDLYTLYDSLRAAAADVWTAGLERAIAYDYAFLYANGLNQLMARGNRQSYWAKYRAAKELAKDARLRQSLALVELERFPKNTAAYLRFVAERRPGALVLSYLAHAVRARLAGR